MSELEISSFVHLGWKKGKRAEARFLILDIRFLQYHIMGSALNDAG